MDSSLYHDLRNSLRKKAEEDVETKSSLRKFATLFVEAINTKIDADPAPAGISSDSFNEGKYLFTVSVAFFWRGQALLKAPIHFSAEKDMNQSGVLFTCIDSGSWRTVPASDLLNAAGYQPVVDLLETPLKEIVGAKLEAPLGGD